MNLERSAPERVQDELSAIVAASGDAIIGKRLDGTITIWNPAAERIYGYAADEVVGRSVELLEPEERRGEIRGFLERLRRGERIADVETLRVRKDGARIPVRLTLSPIRDATGAVVGASTVAHDLSTRRASEAALRQSQDELRQSQKLEAIGRLAGGIAHDFNNLLVVIRGYSELLAARLEGEDLHAVQQISAAADRAVVFTRQLLAFSRRQALRPEPLDLNEIVAGTLALVERSIGDDVRIDTELGPSIGAILGDRSELTNALLNLAINARDAMPAGGTLRIRTTRAKLDDGAYVLLEVSDTGVGMDAETRARVFEPFFTTKEDGTGLGLATVYGLVTQGGGRIAVESAPGAGTTFSLWFPLASPVSALLEPPQPVESLRGDEVILIVEDAELVRELVADTLASQGYRILAASHGEEALALAESHDGPIDVLVTDIVMPGMNGRDLADRLVARRPSLKVLFTSGYPGDVMRRQAGRDEAFLEKPYLPDELGRAIRRLLA